MASGGGLLRGPRGAGGTFAFGSGRGASIPTVMLFQSSSRRFPADTRGSDLAQKTILEGGEVLFKTQNQRAPRVYLNGRKITTCTIERTLHQAWFEFA